MGSRLLDQFPEEANVLLILTEFVVGSRYEHLDFYLDLFGKIAFGVRFLDVRENGLGSLIIGLHFQLRQLLDVD